MTEAASTIIASNQQSFPWIFSSAEELSRQFSLVRHQTENLCRTLEIEDFGVQSMPDVSPTKWHLAHTTWFFETFLLMPLLDNYQIYDANYQFLFNSYYNSIGDRVARHQRGLLSRPTVKEVFRYRAHVNEKMSELLASYSFPTDELVRLTVLGLQHEQQHQELLVTDIKHVFSCNPLRPAFREVEPAVTPALQPLRWLEYPEGMTEIGFEGNGFSFDNESPRHRFYLQGFALANRLVSNGEYQQFMEDDGYQRPELWLSDGWACRNEQDWQAPLYWEQRDGEWWQMTLSGMRPVQCNEPVCHVSYYEADAYARWCQARLPLEGEWESAAAEIPVAGNFVESEQFHPNYAHLDNSDEPQQMFGDVWEWTSSPYVCYPGYQPPAGALGEYNGKFMCNQMVLRGGSCASPQSHLRASYRNFFHPHIRWQFSGIRLARDFG